MAIAQNYQILLAGRVLTGTGAAMLSVVVPKIVFDQVPPESLASLMGGVLAGYPLGFALALLSLPLLGSWRLAMGLCALVCAVAFVATSAIITRSAASGATSASGFRLASRAAAPLLLCRAPIGQCPAPSPPRSPNQSGWSITAATSAAQFG
jgi:predicted MFS family arabinose efflux permease